VNFVAADPDVDLFEALLQNFLLVSEEVFSFERARGIDNDSHQKVFVECAPVPPTAERRDKIRRRG
jgi:hypothetical protein